MAYDKVHLLVSGTTSLPHCQAQFKASLGVGIFLWCTECMWCPQALPEASVGVGMKRA